MTSKRICLGGGVFAEPGVLGHIFVGETS